MLNSSNNVNSGYWFKKQIAIYVMWEEMKEQRRGVFKRKFSPRKSV